MGRRWCPTDVARGRAQRAGALASVGRAAYDSVMDPASLSARRTFRWNDGVSALGYEAVEASTEELVWFRWSHVPGQGRLEETRQTRAEFDAAGPLRAMPAPAEAALRTWLAR